MSEVPRVLSDRYEVGELLGRGGTAEVHAGRDLRLGRRVAIKLLRSDTALDPVFQARFRREARSTAGLNHPAIAAVFDTGEDVRTESGGAQVRTPYIVMEHVDGRTVRDLLDEAGGAGLGTQRAVEITAGILTALQAAHEAGIVHRDVKPANVMVTPSGGIKVMDFGIARAVADTSATMTLTSTVLGTARYISPEQARGEVVDARTDLYSTGCTLYELLTGRPPFVGDSPFAVAYQHVTELPAPPSQHDRAVPGALDRVVMTALAKQRGDRHTDAAGFREHLLAAASGGAVLAPPAAGALPVLPGPRRRRAGVLVVAALAVVLALSGWLPDRGAQEAAGSARATAPSAGGAVEPRTPVALTATSGPAVTAVPAVAAVPDVTSSTGEQPVSGPAAVDPTPVTEPSQDGVEATAGSTAPSAPPQPRPTAPSASTSGGPTRASAGASAAAPGGPSPVPASEQATPQQPRDGSQGRARGPAPVQPAEQPAEQASEQPGPAAETTPGPPASAGQGAGGGGAQGPSAGEGHGGQQGQGTGKGQDKGQDNGQGQDQQGGQGGGRGQRG